MTVLCVVEVPAIVREADEAEGVRGGGFGGGGGGEPRAGEEGADALFFNELERFDFEFFANVAVGLLDGKSGRGMKGVGT